MTSTKGPPLILISNLPPSKPASVLKLFLNVKRTDGLVPNAGAVGMGITGDVKVESLATVPPAPKAEFGAVSGVVVDVTQSAVLFAATLLRAVVQPTGRAGAVTPSKFSVKEGAEFISTPSVNGMLTLPRSRSPS